MLRRVNLVTKALKNEKLNDCTQCVYIYVTITHVIRFTGRYIALNYRIYGSRQYTYNQNGQQKNQ